MWKIWCHSGDLFVVWHVVSCTRPWDQNPIDEKWLFSLDNYFMVVFQLSGIWLFVVCLRMGGNLCVVGVRTYRSWRCIFFATCSFAVAIWYEILMIPDDLFVLLQRFCSILMGGKGWKVCCWFDIRFFGRFERLATMSFLIQIGQQF
jgi:hypothetical protein